MPFRRPVASFRSATASGQKEMTYGGCARPSEVVDSAEVRKKGREEDRAGGREGDGGARGEEMGDKKRTTVVRGYRELHNSWPSHNRAAQGCERADGMSFSFVSRRGDYFSFHSFVPRFLCLPPPPLLSFSSPLFGLTLYLPLCSSRRSFLAIVRETLLIPRSFLSLTLLGPVSFWSVAS